MHLNCHKFTVTYSKNTPHTYMFLISLVHHQGVQQSLHNTVMISSTCFMRRLMCSLMMDQKGPNHVAV